MFAVSVAPVSSPLGAMTVNGSVVVPPLDACQDGSSAAPFAVRT